MRTTISGLLLCAVVFGPVAAQAQDRAAVIGTGQFSCGKYVQYKADNNRAQMDVITQWVWGFMTAYNFRGNFGARYKSVKSGNLATLPDDSTVSLYLENFCRKNPLATVLDGTMELIRDMGGQVAWRQANR